MKAVQLDQFGGPEHLHLADVDPPVPGAGQVRVRVRAAGVNPVDAKIRSGSPQQVFPTGLPAVLGLEVAGTVDAVGADVTAVSVGDDVLGLADGAGYAEHALATTVAAEPAALDWARAAAVPVAAETALRVLRRLAVTAGDTLLVHGASGAVGSMAVQLAVARGATVVDTAGEANQDFVEGTLRLADPRTYDLTEAPSAHAELDSGPGPGKIVLLVGSGR